MDDMVKKFSILFRRSGINLNRSLKTLGVTHGQIMYIMCICEHEGLSQEHLAQELQINKGVVARTMQKFEKNGYITRTLASDDRRQYCLFPTQKAKDIYQAIREANHAWEKHLTRNLSAEEKKTLHQLLDRLLDTLQ